MSKMPLGQCIIPSVRATIIRSFRWKTFPKGDTSTFPASSVFFEIMKKYKCSKPQTVARHILGRKYNMSIYDRRTFGRVLTSTEFLKAMQFLRYNDYINEENANSVIRPLAEWIVSRSEEYDKAAWYF